jgi:hypothetical protein
VEHRGEDSGGDCSSGREPSFRFLLTGGAARADKRPVGFAVRRWLRRQPLRVQCVVFGVFALIGGVFLWAGLAIGDWRRIVSGVLVAVTWPFDTFVWSRIKSRIDARLYG